MHNLKKTLKIYIYGNNVFFLYCKMKNYNNNANNNRNTLYTFYCLHNSHLYNGFREMFYILVINFGISHREPSAANIYKTTQ